MSSTQGPALPQAGEEIDILIQCSGHFSNPFFSSWTHAWLLGREGGGFSHKAHTNQGKEASCLIADQRVPCLSEGQWRPSENRSTWPGQGVSGPSGQMQ